MVTIVWEAVGATVLPHIGGWLTSPFTFKHIKGWAKTLKKPSWNPPDYVFAPVWGILFTSIGAASYLVWRDGGGFSGEARTALSLYAAQLALNWTWPPVFFCLQNLSAALVNIVLLWGTAGATTLAMARINQIAGYLMAPYMFWLTYATAISFSIWRRNPKKSNKDK